MLSAAAAYHGPAVADLSLYGLPNLRLIPYMKLINSAKQAEAYAAPTRASRAQLEKPFKEVPPTAIHILHVTDAHRRWPVGNIKGLSCGAAADGRYCDHHTQIANNKKTPSHQPGV